MNYSYRTFFEKLFEQKGRKYAFQATDKEVFVKWKADFREALHEGLGFPILKELEQEWQTKTGEQASPVIELGEVQEAGYLRRKYAMQTLPDVWMPFYMLIPDTMKQGMKGRAVLAIPAHGANKNTLAGVGETPEERAKIDAAPGECYAKELAEQGYIVFCMDPPGYGERIESMSKEDKAFMEKKHKSSTDCSCKDLAQTAEALGSSLTALEIWDLQKLVDFACTREEVETERIGCVGFSGGGQYTMWLAALDDRIKVAVVSGYIHGYADSLLESHLCPCNYAPNLWLLGDISDIASLIAPRPIYIENGIHDPLNGSQGINGPIEQTERIRKAYRLFEKEENIIHRTPEGSHQWYGLCYGFLDAHL